MNAVEIEAAVSELADASFDAKEFPYAFLAAFGNKETTIARLRKGDTNKSDHAGGVLQRNNIHLAVAPSGQVGQTLSALRASPETARGKVKFVLATDGQTLEAEELLTGETLACDYPKFAGHFGFFLPLAGISTIKEIKDSAVDIRATGRLNKLYLELLRENADWAKEERRHDMNNFMARLIFCFFAEDTGIFGGSSLFTKTVDQMSETTSANTHEVIRTIFQAMNVPTKGNARDAAKMPAWADRFPYVNGGLFGGSIEVPRFTRIARTYLLHAGQLSWHEINPDIFGSMIQAVADDEERGALGMHYTSVPNILKVLNPLFLNDLRDQLQAAGDNKAKLLNLRKRMARIRVFDPACGSGNFLVIAYKQMREIEAEINRRREEPGLKSVIPLTNFRGIELRDFPAEIARLALIIAEYQCDVLYRGQMEAVQEFLPLDAENWITCGNALRLDWLALCPPTGTGVKLVADDLFQTPLAQPEIDFENEGGEIYVCGNPPYYGSRKQEEIQKHDIQDLCGHFIKKWKSLDYVAGWFLCAKRYMETTNAECAFVATSSICEGLQVGILWPHILNSNISLKFGVRPFKWANLAAKNAGVTVVIVGLTNKIGQQKVLFSEGGTIQRVDALSPYLAPSKTVFVDAIPEPISALPKMVTGSMPRDGGNLILSTPEAASLLKSHPESNQFIRQYIGSDELINGGRRHCLWIGDNEVRQARSMPEINSRLIEVSRFRSESTLDSTREYADKPHRFVYLAGKAKYRTIAVGTVSSERRQFLPVDMFDSKSIISNLALALYDSPAWCLSLISSRLHLVWIAAVCGKLETRYRYSNTLGWNTFPVPTLTEQNKVDLTRRAEDILLAREAHFPATIADLYDPDTMPENLRRAHEQNDETLERIYIGRRFRNDTERLEKLFDLYTKMTVAEPKQTKRTNTRARKTAS